MDYVDPIGKTGGAPYVDGDPANDIEGDPVSAKAWEHPMREILAVITGAGLAPDAGDLTQLQQAILAMVTANLDGYLRGDTSALLTAGFLSDPLTLDASEDGTATPDLTARNAFVIDSDGAGAIDRTVTLNDPAAIPGAGMALIRVTQNAAGGHGLNLGPAYRVQSGTFDKEPNAVNWLYLTLDGGSVIDVDISQRGEA